MPHGCGNVSAGPRWVHRAAAGMADRLKWSRVAPATRLSILRAISCALGRRQARRCVLYSRIYSMIPASADIRSGGPSFCHFAEAFEGKVNRECKEEQSNQLGGRAHHGAGQHEQRR